MTLFNKREKKTGGLNIIIVGGGAIGSALVEQLSGEGHDITVIDKDAERVQELSNMYDIMGICGNGASFSVQLEAGVKDADLIIAVTNSDELNLLCCTIGRRTNKCAAIARLRNPEYSLEQEYLKEKLGLTMIINPEQEAAREMSRILLLPTALEVVPFAHGAVELVKIRVPQGSMIDGMTIAELGKRVNHEALICAIERDKNITIPNGDFELKAGDRMSFVSPRKKTGEFLKSIGFKSNKVKNTMIIGGGDSAYYLARNLIHAGIDVKIIEKNRARCEELSVAMPKATVICGSGADEDLLKEEGIDTTEAFVALTGSDEENILMTMYASQNIDTKVITQINRITFNNVINQLDLGSVVYPKYITSEAIIAYVRAKNASIDSNIETLSHMFDHRVEAIEFSVKEQSKITDKPLSELKMKDNLLISFINRHGKIIIPSGQDCIKAGDTVMIVTTHTGFTDITNILQ